MTTAIKDCLTYIQIKDNEPSKKEKKFEPDQTTVSTSVRDCVLSNHNLLYSEMYLPFKEVQL